MNQQGRVVRTLACLVGAMTAAAALLAWADPTGALPEPALSTEQIIALAEARVVDATRAGAAMWREIAITPGTALPGHGTKLVGAPARDDVHFSVDVDGRAECGLPWRRQQFVTGAAGAVRIEVVEPSAGGPMTSSQWLCVRTLIAALNRRVMPPGGSLPIRLHAAWARVYGLEEGAVHRLATGGHL
ncbi:MAG: hypothetical protein ACE5E6_07820 [Phycisphaerae bacterium]